MDYEIYPKTAPDVPDEIRIKYDLKDKKKSLLLLLAWPVTLTLWIALVSFSGNESANSYIYLLCTVMVMAKDIAPFVSLKGLSDFTKACGYLSRLKAHGYTLPYDKQAYNCSLQNLPQNRAVRIPATSRECERFKIIYAVMGILSFLFSVEHFLINNGCLGDARYKLFIIWNIITLLLAFHSVRCHIERDNRIYRDDIEIDPCRRPRHHAI